MKLAAIKLLVSFLRVTIFIKFCTATSLDMNSGRICFS